MAWTIDYTATAKKQLRKLDIQVARRIVDFMDERVAAKNGPRSTGKALTGPMLGACWRYRVGDCRVICGIQDGADVHDLNFWRDPCPRLPVPETP